MDKSQLITLLLTVLLPAIWTSAGPIANAAITGFVNGTLKTYVPRPVQLIIASVAGSFAAALTGVPEGMDPTTVNAAGAAAGLAGQTLAMMKPDTLLTGTKPAEKAP
jgi:hypothetical protein